MANAITVSRIVCALGLIVCPTFSTWFYVLYIIGGVIDFLPNLRYNEPNKPEFVRIEQ